jgi:hypothetical protein
VAEHHVNVHDSGSVGKGQKFSGVVMSIIFIGREGLVQQVFVD